MISNDLSSVSTSELVDELINRAGVIVDYVDPYEDKTFSMNGPAIILTIID